MVSGVPTCGALARSWCHKMQLWYDYELGHDDGIGAVFTAELFGVYVEPAELTHLAASTANAEVIKRIDDIRGLFALFFKKSHCSQHMWKNTFMQRV